MTRRLAIVHDWLTGMRGGEKVLEVVCERFPDADLFTLVHVPGSVSPTIERHRIHTSFVQHLPAARRHYRHYLPVFPFAVERLDLSGFDFVLSISHCAVKSVVRPPQAFHLCYCLTPMRYAWDQFDAYFGPDRVGQVGSRVMRPVMRRLAQWDQATADRVDRYVAISHYVAGRIRRYYNREAAVVYPPVDTDFYVPAAVPPEPFALVVSALVPYKRIDLAIHACERAGVPLKVVGAGPDQAALESIAGPGTTFLGRLPDSDVRDLYRRASVVLLPGEEDFGIVPLEAQACGRPVVALGRGAALETVLPGITGELVPDSDVEPFADAIAKAVNGRYDSSDIRRHAERFGRTRFGDEIETLMATAQAAGRA
ncbi:MAG: glycosyltransferase [Vicinamibacterales bacterium]